MLQQMLTYFLFLVPNSGVQENNLSDTDSNDGDWLPNDEENQNQDVDGDEDSDVDLDSSDEALASHSKY